MPFARSLSTIRSRTRSDVSVTALVNATLGAPVRSNDVVTGRGNWLRAPSLRIVVAPFVLTIPDGLFVIAGVRADELAAFAFELRMPVAPFAPAGVFAATVPLTPLRARPAACAFRLGTAVLVAAGFDAAGLAAPAFAPRASARRGSRTRSSSPSGKRFARSPVMKR